MPIPIPTRPTSGGKLSLATKRFGDWHTQPKFNGWRAVISVHTQEICNRKEGHMRLNEAFTDGLDELCEIGRNSGFTWMDCEAMGPRTLTVKGVFIVLDVIDPTLTYLERRAKLKDAFKIAPLDFRDWGKQRVMLTPAFASDPMDVYETLHELNAGDDPVYEGVVLKRTDAKYEQMRNLTSRSATAIKFRFD